MPLCKEISTILLSFNDDAENESTDFSIIEEDIINTYYVSNNSKYLPKVGENENGYQQGNQ